MGFWIVLALVGSVLFSVVVRRWTLYARIYSPDFVRELQGGLARAKGSALAATGQQLPPEQLLAAGSAFVTKPGLAFVYTITESGEAGAETARRGPSRSEHLLSISYQGGWFARSAAGYVAALLRRLLQLAMQTETSLAQASSGVFYFSFQLSPQEYAAYAAHPVAALDETEVRTLIASCAQNRVLMNRRPS